MKNQINKNEANNIAKVMIASAGLAFDSFAFDELEGTITESDIDLILSEIQKECNKVISAVEAKLNTKIDYRATESIVLSMYFEDETENVKIIES